MTTETSFAAACQLADRVCKTIEDHEFKQRYRLSASFGVAAYSGDSVATLFKRTDLGTLPRQGTRQEPRGGREPTGLTHPYFR